MRIRTARDEDWATVEVIDHGTGIPLEHRQRLFDPFFTTKTHGTGLGLAVSQRIMTDHGGRVDVDAADRGGTVVRIALPVSSAALSPLR